MLGRSVTLGVLVCAGGALLVPARALGEPRAPSETHVLRVRGTVEFRCYAGYDGKRVVDERTGKPCDNKTYRSKPVDKTVALQIIDEPDPVDSKELAGSWLENFTFQGRKFTIAISLFKGAGERPYRIRLVARDDEPTPRQTAVFSELKAVKGMPPLSVEYSSAGKKEEVTFTATVSPESS